MTSGYPEAIPKAAWPSPTFPLSRAMSTHNSQRHHRRSRSPRYYSVSPDPQIRRRSRSPHSHRHHHRRSSHQHKDHKPVLPRVLPLHATPISRHDFETYKFMFGLYLDIQKQLVLEELPADETKGRWKSFVGKWYVTVAGFDLLQSGLLICSLILPAH